MHGFLFTADRFLFKHYADWEAAKVIYSLTYSVTFMLLASGVFSPLAQAHVTDN